MRPQTASRSRFPKDPRTVGAVAEVCALEVGCCSFFSFTLTLDVQTARGLTSARPPKPARSSSSSSVRPMADATTPSGGGANALGRARCRRRARRVRRLLLTSVHRRCEHPRCRLCGAAFLGAAFVATALVAAGAGSRRLSSQKGEATDVDPGSSSVPAADARARYGIGRERGLRRRGHVFAELVEGPDAALETRDESGGFELAEVMAHRRLAEVERGGEVAHADRLGRRS